MDQEIFDAQLDEWVHLLLVQPMSKAGFSYQSAHRIFTHNSPKSVQKIQIYTDRNPHGLVEAFASLVPKIHIEMREISDLAIALVGHNRSVLPAHRFVVAMPVTSCCMREQKTGKIQLRINNSLDIEDKMRLATNMILDDALPFVLQFENPACLLQMAEQKDRRLRMDQRMYIFLVAARLLSGEKSLAVEMANKRFGRMAGHPRYETFLQNVAAY